MLGGNVANTSSGSLGAGAGAGPAYTVYEGYVPDEFSMMYLYTRSISSIVSLNAIVLSFISCIKAGAFTGAGADTDGIALAV